MTRGLSAIKHPASDASSTRPATSQKQMLPDLHIGGWIEAAHLLRDKDRQTDTERQTERERKRSERKQGRRDKEGWRHSKTK